MPTITLQVGQCGNQVGAVLWERLAAQCAAVAGPWDRALGTERELFRLRPDGRRTARCVLVDTEPKVVNSVLAADREGLFTRQMCYLGQSGRGNNWAFGYNQISVAADADAAKSGGAGHGGGRRGGGAAATALAPAAAPAPAPAWVSSTNTEDPSKAEFLILEQVIDGIRREAEECDGCPSFMLLHSLAGGSGSGMGSRLLEHLRADFPLSYIVAASVVPRVAGDTPMQSLNATMALSFVQAYADVGLLLSNQDLMDAAAKLGAGAAGAGGGGLSDVNRLAAQCLAGFLWPLDGQEALGAGGRIRDTVCTVGADPCTKLLETWTAHAAPGVPASSLWPDALRRLAALAPRADTLQDNAPITTAGALVLARGFPSAAVSAGSPAAALSAYVRSLGPHGAAPSLQPDVSLLLRCGDTPVVQGAAGEGRRGGGAGASAGATRPVSAPASTAPSVSVVANRSHVVGLLEGTVRRALATCEAGAYLHWYARHGCSREAVHEAAHTLLDVADCYRLLHRMAPDGS